MVGRKVQRRSTCERLLVMMECTHVSKVTKAQNLAGQTRYGGRSAKESMVNTEIQADYKAPGTCNISGDIIVEDVITPHYQVHSQASSHVNQDHCSPQRIRAEGWTNVSHRAHLPVLLTVSCRKEVTFEGDGKVLLSRVGDKINATSAFCTHYGAPLAKGVLTSDGRVVWCAHPIQVLNPDS